LAWDVVIVDNYAFEMQVGGMFVNASQAIQ
jgi:hypothetical protein